MANRLEQITYVNGNGNTRVILTFSKYNIIHDYSYKNGRPDLLVVIIVQFVVKEKYHFDNCTGIMGIISYIFLTPCALAKYRTQYDVLCSPFTAFEFLSRCLLRAKAKAVEYFSFLFHSELIFIPPRCNFNVACWMDKRFGALAIESVLIFMALVMQIYSHFNCCIVLGKHKVCNCLASPFLCHTFKVS